MATPQPGNQHSRMSIPSFLLFAMLLAFKRKAQCRHFDTAIGKASS
jgi:hypothetical protein